MQNRLRVRRLTLAPVRECLDEEPASAEEDEVDINRTGSDIGSGQKQVIQRAMKRRSFNRHPSQRSQRPSWCAKRKGRGSQSEDLRQAEEEVIGSPSTNNCSVPAGSLVKRIVDELVVRNKPRPWRGALPSLRLSPMRWRKQRYDQRRYVLHRTSGSPLPDHACRSCHRHNLRARIRGPILDLGKADQGVIKGIQISVINGGPTRCRRRWCPGPDLPYRPTSGLVAMFSRTGTSIINPRAPHTSIPRAPPLSRIWR
jgi:hypothetical protein